MSNTPSLFGKNGALAIPDSLMERFKQTTDRLAGGLAAEYRRISIRGGRFRKIVAGEQLEVSKDSEMNIIVVDAAPVARTYFEKGWDSENPTPPSCWSPDGNAPHPEVPKDQRQSDKCVNCPMNVKGSGTNNTRACRFSQRMAVMVEGDLENVYQLQVPATSIFGKPEGNKMALQAYTRVLKDHATPINVIVTQMQFDEDSESPKLFFKPVRPLNAEEIARVEELLDSEDVARCLNMTVSQNDDSAKPAPVEDDEDDEEEEEAPKPKATRKRKPKPEPAPVEDDEDEEEDAPKKRSIKKAKPEPEDDEDEEDGDELSKMLSQWDDGDDDEDDED